MLFRMNRALSGAEHVGNGIYLRFRARHSQRGSTAQREIDYPPHSKRLPSQQKLSPHCPEAIFVPVLPSLKLSLQLSLKFSLKVVWPLKIRYLRIKKSLKLRKYMRILLFRDLNYEFNTHAHTWEILSTMGFELDTHSSRFSQEFLL